MTTSRWETRRLNDWFFPTLLYTLHIVLHNRYRPLKAFPLGLCVVGINFTVTCSARR